MKGKIPAVTFLIFGLVFGAVVFDAQAGHDKDKKIGYRCYGKDKLSEKAHFILKNRTKLGLTDEQVKEIKAMKIAAKKDKIAKEAEIDTISVDIKAEMWKTPMDVGTIESLIDRKYELKKEKTKSMIRSYVKLENVLTEEQKQKMKELCKK